MHWSTFSWNEQLNIWSVWAVLLTLTAWSWKPGMQGNMFCPHSTPSPGCSRVLVFYPGPLFSLPSHVNSKIWTCNSPWGSILYGKERTQDVTLWHGHVRFLWVLQELGIQWQETIKISKSLLSLHLVVPTFIRSKGVQWKVHLDPRSGRHEGVKQSSFPDHMRSAHKTMLIFFGLVNPAQLYSIACSCSKKNVIHVKL